MPRVSRLQMNKSAIWLTISALLAALLVPILVTLNNRVDALQVTARSIDIQSSEADVETDYLISFTVPDTGVENIGAFRVEFCDDDPLVNTTCAFDGVGDDIPQVDTNAGTIATLNGAPTFDGETISMTAPGVGAHDLTFTLGSVTDPAVDTTFSVQVDDIDNPDNSTDGDDNNTFYARVYVYDTITPPASANPQSNTNQIHDGGIAMSTAEVITVDARVQEVLDFCVGTIITTDGDCSTISGNSIDLGTLDQTAVTYSRALDTTGGTAGCDMDDTDECAVLVVTTNATNDGVTIDYRAEAFDVLATCSSGTTAGGSVTDQCINPVHESAETSMAVAGEDWGIAVVADTRHASSTTLNLQSGLNQDVAAAYDYESTGYAVDDGDSPTLLAQSDLQGANTPAERVVDREQLEIEIAASPAYTTPSGAYQTTLEFIATSTF